MEEYLLKINMTSIVKSHASYRVAGWNGSTSSIIKHTSISKFSIDALICFEASWLMLNIFVSAFHWYTLFAIGVKTKAIAKSCARYYSRLVVGRRQNVLLCSLFAPFKFEQTSLVAEWFKYANHILHPIFSLGFGFVNCLRCKNEICRFQQSFLTFRSIWMLLLPQPNRQWLYIIAPVRLTTEHIHGRMRE